MAEATPKQGETDAEKAARETGERERNQAKEDVKSWVKEAVQAELKTPKTAPKATSAPPAARKSLYQIITGG